MTDLLDNKIFLAVGSAVLGAILALVVQRILAKRGLFTYNVLHNRVGISADDPIFGAVQVTWNGKAVPNLYSSTVELRNESLKDFEDVAIRVFTGDTFLLTERTELVGTTHILKWTEEFSQRLAVPSGQSPTQEQHTLYDGRRDYLIPILNRSQVVRLTFLNVPKEGRQPTIWLDVLHKGVTLKFRVAPNQFMGVSHPLAVTIGTAVGVMLLAILVRFVATPWIVATASMLCGLLAVIPGALVVRAWRWVRDAIGG